MISIYIGLFAFEFKRKNPSVSVSHVRSKEDVMEWIETYSGISSSMPIAIEDISYLSTKNQSLLLKFLDETNFDVSMLARFDSILPTIFSRCDRIYKKSIPIQRNNTSIEEAYSSYLASKHPQEKWKLVSEQNPKLYYYLHTYPGFNRKTITFF